MRPNNHTGVEVKSVISGDRIAMSVDQSAMAHIMRIMTDLYSDTEMAPLREYSTNAHDAHVMVGQTRPIEVSTPSGMSPFLRVKDYGVGLTVDDIHDIYVKYGASTKRSSDDFNGMLGLGCKSALTYTSQFTLTTVKDGVKVLASVSRDEDGGGSLTIVETSTTDEPNGTEVTIPAKRGNDLLAKAEEFFSFWPAGTVLLNGKAPARFDERDDALKVADGMFIVKGWTEAKIIMGNVAYPAPSLTVGLPQDYYNRSALCVFVPIGTVSFTPNREALMDDRTTKAAIQGIKDAFNREVENAIQREVDVAPAAHEAIKVLLRWNSLVPNRARVNSFTYRGKTVPQMFSPGIQPDRDAALLVADSTGSHGRGKALGRAGIPVEEWPNTLFVEDFAPANYSALIGDKLRKWCADNGIQFGRSAGVSQFVMIPNGKAPDSEFVNPDHVVDYQTIRAIQLVTKDASGNITSLGRIPGSYDVYVDGNYKHGVPGSQIDRSKPIFWIHGNKYAAGTYVRLLAKFHQHFYVVCLGGNRVEKWKRDVPESKPAREGVQAAYDGWAKALTADQRLNMTMRDKYVRDDLRVLKSYVNDLKDPDLAKAVKVSLMDTNALMDSRKQFKGLLHVDDMAVPFRNPLLAYPLFDTHTVRTNGQHVVNYLNDAYMRASV